ncbi:MAG: class I SAM-dependent methyltransferase [Candidatus Hydrogenedentes bacterium]|nr:class I SAM-dependent methyltransferase [Candidatus Hydrogenedentota bacterium]
MGKGIGERLRAYAEKDGRGYPDWALRYLPVARRLRPVLREDARVLEIGANENGLARFTGVRTICVDVARAHLAAARTAQPVLPVVADAGALPFRDGVFEVCACMDTFEHFSAETRERAVLEIVRVTAASGIAAVGFPSGEAAMRAEEVIRKAYFASCGRQLKWLEEHAQFPLPDAREIAALFALHAGPVRRIAVDKNANVRVWTFMWRILMCGWPGRGNALCQVILRWCTPLLCRMHVGTCYRAIVWMEPKP